MNRAPNHIGPRRASHAPPRQRRAGGDCEHTAGVGVALVPMLKLMFRLPKNVL